MVLQARCWSSRSSRWPHTALWASSHHSSLSVSDFPSIQCPNPSFSQDSCTISCLFILHLNNLVMHFCAKQFQNCFPGDTSQISLWRFYIHKSDQAGSGPYLGAMAGSSWIWSSWTLTWQKCWKPKNLFLNRRDWVCWLKTIRDVLTDCWEKR